MQHVLNFSTRVHTSVTIHLDYTLSDNLHVLIYLNIIASRTIWRCAFILCITPTVCYDDKNMSSSFPNIFRNIKNYSRSRYYSEH